MLKNIYTFLLIALLPAAAAAIEWDKAKYEKLKNASEMNVTIDFSHGIYNGSDSASLAQALGKEAGWEVTFFNTLRNNLIDGKGYNGPAFCKPAPRRKYNLHVDVLEVGEHGEMTGRGIFWTDDFTQASRFPVGSAGGRWNDFNELLLEQSKNDWMKGGIWGNLKFFIESNLRVKEEVAKLNEKLAKESPKYLSPKYKAKSRKTGKEYIKYIELKNGNEEIFDTPAPLTVKAVFDSTCYNERPIAELVSDVDDMAEFCEAYFASGFNNKSKGPKVVSDPSQARYRVEFVPTYITRKGWELLAMGRIDLYEIGNEATPVCSYEFSEIKHSLFNIWSGHIDSEQEAVAKVAKQLAEIIAGE